MNPSDVDKALVTGYALAMQVIPASQGTELSPEDCAKAWNLLRAIANGTETLVQSSADLLAKTDSLDDEIRSQIAGLINSQTVDQRKNAQRILSVLKGYGIMQ
jgi:hypothetical protein